MKAKLFPSMAAVAAFTFLMSAPVAAQWLDYKTPGIPRTADGKPNLSAPAPKTPDGKPDLSGIWRGPRASVYTQNIAATSSPTRFSRGRRKFTSSTSSIWEPTVRAPTACPTLRRTTILRASPGSSRPRR